MSRLPPDDQLPKTSSFLADGVTHAMLSCTCYAHHCWHQSHVTLDSLPPGAPVASLKRHFRCGNCGCRPTDSRPTWHTRKGVPGIVDAGEPPYPQFSIWPRGVLGRR